MPTASHAPEPAAQHLACAGMRPDPYNPSAFLGIEVLQFRWVGGEGWGWGHGGKRQWRAGQTASQLGCTSSVHSSVEFACICHALATSQLL